ncbi:SAM-dependent methyltransferase [Rubinisphaera margarita]|uniref:SAM-dependent methyltransferase n=1 Tax=Rubinisphaera margarita TaxID=2909586 RepID=UPI001EE7E08C|nr:class I SAM-dependent methyltransferase [Rubinisphaera margarita]MCG6156830.1 class I SAM-dependent methyltransferase [Rubinisphaera margarita]
MPVSPPVYEHPPLPRRISMRTIGWIRTNLVPVSVMKRRMNSSSSPLIQEFMQNPGGWRAMEIIYENARPKSLWDWYVLRGLPLSIEARNRRRYFVHTLSRWMQEKAAARPLRMLILGSGPALDVLEAMQSQNGPFDVDAVDLDEGAVIRGREEASRLELSDQITFHHGDVRSALGELAGKSYEIISLIGLAEYLSDEELTDVLQELSEHAASGCRIITHAYEDTFHSESTLSRMFGIRIHSRTAVHISRMLNDTGFSVQEIEATPLGIYPMILASPMIEPASIPVPESLPVERATTNRVSPR